MKTIKPSNTPPEPCLRPEELIISNEGRFQHKNPPWEMVEQVISDIDTGTGNSYCCLTAPGVNYIQALHGFNGYHLEWRVTQPGNIKKYIHYRASYPGASPKAMELKKHNHISAGQHRDLLLLEDVLDGFTAFYNGEEMPAHLHWRQLSI